MHALFLAVALVAQQPPAVVAEGPSRDATVILDGVAYRVKTIAVVTPAPTPTPTPIPGPTPDPTPDPDEAKAFGPLARMLVLYESSTTDASKVPFGSQTFADSAAGLLPKPTAGSIADYRCWDYDLDASKLPDWQPFLKQAKEKAEGDKSPRLFAWDAKGRMRVLPIAEGDTPDGLVAKIKGLK